MKTTEILKKTSLFWDAKDVNPQKNTQFIIERILTYGDEADFKWALAFYGNKKIKECFLKIKNLDKKSLSFWCQYLNLNQSKCIQNQFLKERAAFWKK